jgi:hypothetical protein
MLRLTPRLVRRTLLPAIYLAFLARMLVSGMIFYRGKPFDPKAAILSDLQSPNENPHGYGLAAVGLAFFAILLARQFKPPNKNSAGDPDWVLVLEAGDK